jgi:methionyl aminopeptidase
VIQIKNAKELDGMRKANALSAAALKYGGEHIEAGMTTWELDKLIYDFIVKHGGTPNFKGLYGFPGTACISLNDTIIHGIPSHDIVIRPGDIVSIDTGAKIDGFNGDNACTYAVGKIDLEAQRLLDVTKAALYKGIEQAKAGNRIGDIGYAVQSYCEDAGFSVVREFVGHGTGRELHEDPEVPNYGHQGRGPRLVPGIAPNKASLTEVTGRSPNISSIFTLLTAPVKLAFFCTPYPTTTTSSKVCVSSFKVIDKGWLPSDFIV